MGRLHCKRAFVVVANSELDVFLAVVKVEFVPVVVVVERYLGLDCCGKRKQGSAYT